MKTYHNSNNIYSHVVAWLVFFIAVIFTVASCKTKKVNTSKTDSIKVEENIAKKSVVDSSTVEVKQQDKNISKTQNNIVTEIKNLTIEEHFSKPDSNGKTHLVARITSNKEGRKTDKSSQEIQSLKDLMINTSNYQKSLIDSLSAQVEQIKGKDLGKETDSTASANVPWYAWLFVAGLIFILISTIKK
jgi:hypothetical protein